MLTRLHNKLTLSQTKCAVEGTLKKKKNLHHYTRIFKLQT